LALENEFNIQISDDDAEAIHSIDDAVNYFMYHPHSA
jgi:acyl carrier protein